MMQTTSVPIDLRLPAAAVLHTAPSAELLRGARRRQRTARGLAGTALFAGWASSATMLLGMSVFGISILGSFICLCVMVLSLRVHRLAQRLERSGDRLETQWNQRHSYMDERPPFLVLRSFTEPALTVDLPVYGPRNEKDGDIPGDSHLRRLGEAVQDLGRLLAIGTSPAARTPDAPRTLFLDVDDTDWFALFTSLAVSSRAVILIPDTTPGIVREVEALRQSGLMGRLIVYMPPTPRGFPWWGPFRHRDPGLYARRWAEVREYWRREGLALPEYDPAGMLYHAREDLSVGTAVPLNPWNRPSTLASAFRCLMAVLPHDNTQESKSLALLIRSASGLGARWGEGGPARPERMAGPGRGG